MLEPGIYAALTAVAVLTGFIDAIAGGGGLIMMPALLSAGLPPINALATNKLQSMFGTATACFNFARKGLVDWRANILTVLFVFVGASAGVIVVQTIDTRALSLIIPLLLMGGQVGRMFREFAVTLSAAVMISLVISLTTTPMMCAWLLRPDAHARRPGRIGRALEGTFGWVHRAYAHSLDWALHMRWLVLLILLGVVVLNAFLFVQIPKGFFPQQDSGQLQGGRILRISPDGKITALVEKLPSFGDHHTNGPAIGPDGQVYFSVGVATNSGVVGEDNFKFGWL